MSVVRVNIKAMEARLYVWIVILGTSRIMRVKLPANLVREAYTSSQKVRPNVRSVVRANIKAMKGSPSAWIALSGTSRMIRLKPHAKLVRQAGHSE